METIKTFLEVYGIICLITFCLAMYFVIRSYKVRKFRSSIFETILKARGAVIHTIEKKIIGRPSFYRMTFSFKPLKLKYWFTDEEAKLIDSLKKESENKVK